MAQTGSLRGKPMIRGHRQAAILSGLFLALVWFGPVLAAQETPVVLDHIPVSMDDFLALRGQMATSPEGGAAIFLAAFLVYSRDPALGRQMLVVALDQGRLTEGRIYKGFDLRKSDLDLMESQLRRQFYLAQSYFEGSSPANDYTLPDGPLTLYFSENSYSGNRETGAFKVFVRCSGADSPRPLTLARNQSGIWKVREFSSVLSGIRKPAAETPKDEL